MKIALAQIKPLKGNIPANLALHKKWIQLAVKHKANLIIFPELSMTGYEPTLAKTLAVAPSNQRFEAFQALSNQHQIIIGIGAPIKKEKEIFIGLLFFHPHQPKQLYTKKYLHADEFPFFTEGQNDALLIRKTSIAPAICYELSVPAHFQAAKKNGATLYLASVAKTEKGMEAAQERLSGLASNHSIPTLIVNCVGFCDNFESAGQSAVWDNQGHLLGQLKPFEEGMLFFDTKTKAIKSILN